MDCRQKVRDAEVEAAIHVLQAKVLGLLSFCLDVPSHSKSNIFNLAVIWKPVAAFFCGRKIRPVFRPVFS
jgi:hypothetical protein